MTTETKQTEGKLENKEPILLERNETWEKNHDLITEKMAILIRRNSRWPSKAEIAKETGLDRRTIYRHMQDLLKQDIMTEQLEELKFMMGEVTGNMLDMVMQGDVKAMRLAYEVAGVLKKGKAVVPAQTTGAGSRNKMMA
jgi:hypothetical protein